MDEIPTEILVEDMIRKDLWLAVYKMAFEDPRDRHDVSAHAERCAQKAVDAYDRKFNDKGDGLV